jgi:hypothetical protein
MGESDESSSSPEPGEQARRHGLYELIGERRAKRERLREQDLDAFPHAFVGVEPISS